MILDTLKQANSAMLDSIQVTTNKQAAKTFKEQVLQLGVITPQLEQLLNVIICLNEKEIAKDLFTQELKDSLQTTVDNCGEKANDHTLDAATVLALKNAYNLCKSATDSAWKEAADSKSEAVVSSLTSLRNLLPDKKTADELLEEINSAKVQMPTSTKSIQTFLDNIEKGKQLVNGLHLDDETEIFINKVKLQRATVSDLTPHILTWLKDNNLLETLKVRF